MIHGFAKMLPQQTLTVRNGNIETVEAEELVVGDIVVLRTGARVPADLRLITCTDLKLETSAMTGTCARTHTCSEYLSAGESEPLDSTASEVPEHMSAMDGHNIAFNSSMALDGEGYGVVIRTGDSTFIGEYTSNASRLHAALHYRQSSQADERAKARCVKYVHRDQPLCTFYRNSLDYNGRAGVLCRHCHRPTSRSDATDCLRVYNDRCS